MGAVLELPAPSLGHFGVPSSGARSQEGFGCWWEALVTLTPLGSSEELEWVGGRDVARTKSATIHTLINMGDTSCLCHCGGVGTHPFHRICVRMSRHQGRDIQVHPPRLGFRQDLVLEKCLRDLTPLLPAWCSRGTSRIPSSCPLPGQWWPGPEIACQSSAPADPLRYATNYSTCINDFAAKGEMT